MRIYVYHKTLITKNVKLSFKLLLLTKTKYRSTCLYHLKKGYDAVSVKDLQMSRRVRTPDHQARKERCGEAFTPFIHGLCLYTGN